MMQFDKFQAFGKDGVEAAMRSMSALTNGAQAVAMETTDFAKRSFEQGSKTAERLLGAKSFDVAMQIQNDFARSTYENLVSQATKVNDIVVNTAKAAYAPVESFVAKPVAA